MRIRIGTRQSKLALVQAEGVATWLRTNHPGLEVELVGMTTVGDQILDKKLDKIGGKGLFIKELEVALLAGTVDIAVHSAKDLPAQIATGLEIIAVSQREDPRDALVSRHPGGFKDLPQGAVVGTSSARRECQLHALRPDLEIRMLRGNVLTRLEKLQAGTFDAIVLAAAGLTRLGLQAKISSFFETSQMVPAVGQGILAIEAKAGFDASLFSGFHDEDSSRCLLAERSAMLAMHGDCSVPLGVFASLKGSEMGIAGFYGLEGKLARSEMNPSNADSTSIGTDLANALLRAWETA
jgi:hydroxymethylbilane synthase